MPIRIASLTERISANGQALHRAMMSRMETHGADHEPSEAERVLIEERRLLKEERDKRHAQAMQPKPSAAERLVRTHHAQAKDKPKAKKEPKDAKQAKPAKPHKSRAEKHAAKAAALDAARSRPKKPAK
jgi:hypothetical protein